MANAARPATAPAVSHTEPLRQTRAVASAPRNAPIPATTRPHQQTINPTPPSLITPAVPSGTAFLVYKPLLSCYNTSIMAKKNNTKRKLIGLVSEESGIRAYYTKKNTMNTPDKLSLRKYDPLLRKHVVFTETKKNLGRNEVKEKKR